MSLLSNLLSGILVEAPRRAASSAVSNLVGAGISSGVSNLAANAITAGRAPTTYTTNTQQTQTQPTGDAGTVEGVEVVGDTSGGAAPVAGDIGGGGDLLQSIIGSMADGIGDMGGDGGGGGEIDIPAMQRQLANVNGANTLAGSSGGDTLVEGVDITGQRPTGIGLGDTNVPGLLAASLASNGFLTADAMNAGQQELKPDEETPEAKRRRELLEKYGPLGLLGLLPLKDLIAGGLLGGSLLLNNNNDKKITDPNGPAGPLTQLANNNAATAKALTAGGVANMNGNIGGQALGYIARHVRQAQAAIRQRYAGMGMNGSTAEQQDLNAATEAGVDMQFKFGQQMAQTGLNAAASLAGQSATIYAALLNQQTQRDTQLGNALAAFAAAVVR